MERRRAKKRLEYPKTGILARTNEINWNEICQVDLGADDINLLKLCLHWYCERSEASDYIYKDMNISRANALDAYLSSSIVNKVHTQ